MFKTILVLILTAPIPAVWAQPHEINLPKLRTDKAVEDANAKDDPLVPYGGEKGRHEAAVAAFQAAFDAASTRPPDRAMRLFLLSLRREPMPKTLYDLAIICARDYRWQDAISFQSEAQQQTTAPEVAKLAALELERLQTVAALEGSPSGKQIREFDIRFIQIVNHAGNPVGALDDLKPLMKQYEARWEGPALAGVLYADLHKFAESRKALETAASIAPLDRRKHLQQAAELARQEATFNEQRISADELWEKKDYEPAAQHYASAWENSPGRLDVGLLAATGFMMADRVNLAVEILSRMRALATGEMATRIVAMLNELAVISEDAKRAASGPGGSGGLSNEDTPAHMRSLIGQLTSRQMELAAKPDPPLLADKTNIPHVPDAELTGPSINLPLLSTDRVYDQYKRDQPPAAPVAPVVDPATNPASPGPPQADAKPVPAPSLTPAAQAANNDAVRPPADLPRVAGGAIVAAAGDPPGSAIVFDDVESTKCVTPCQIALAPGRHTWRATLDGYRAGLGVINIEKGKKPEPVNASLKEKLGFLTIESSAPGQPVFVDGRKTENVTPCRMKLREGRYQVGVEIDGKMVTQDLDVKDEAWSRIRF